VVAATEQQELERREQAYRDGRPAPTVRSMKVMLVVDGLATGTSMRAAVAALRRREPSRIVVAVPVAAVDTCAALENAVDEIVCAHTPQPFYAVGVWYDNFTQTTDEEVRNLLTRAAAASASAATRT
jgi:predicted phosphoribosyltransferase